METLTIGKSQDLEDAVEECQSKVERRRGEREGREDDERRGSGKGREGG